MTEQIDRDHLVSCIMIFWDAEEFIEEAIESVFAQTYDNWELLLVDDGSTDGSTAIAQGYVQKYPEKVYYLEHEGHQNRGMSAARNLGIEYAEGEYIAFLDADDIWLPQKLAEQVAIFHDRPQAGMIYGPALMWHSWTGQPEDRQKDYFFKLGVQSNTLVQPHKLLVLLLYQKTQIPHTSNAIIRREVFVKVGRFEEIFRGMYEDQVFFIKVLLHLPVFVSGDCWSKYRQHPNSCYWSTVKDIEKYTASKLFFWDWARKYLVQQKMRDPKVWFPLLKHMWWSHHPQLLYRWNLTKKQIKQIIQIGWRTLTTSVVDWLWRFIFSHL